MRRYSNLLPLAILKFATPPPASVSTSPVPPPNTAIRRPCPTTPIDFPISLQAPIFKIPTPESPHYNNADEPITDFCLIIENSEKVSFQTCNDLVMCALCDDSGPLQVLHRQDPSQFRIHVFFRLQSGILPALTPGIRWSDRASVFLRWMLSMESRHCPVSSCRVWRSQTYWPAWVGTHPMGDCSHVGLTRTLVRAWDTRIGQVVGKFQMSWVDITGLSTSTTLLLSLNIPLVTNSSLFGTTPETQ